MPHVLFGYSIDCDVHLARARSGTDGRGTLRIRCSDEDLLAREGELVSWDERDGIQFALATSDRDLLAWCSLTGSYLIRGHQGQILARPTGARDHWEHRLGATIVPLALAERDDLSLHASAILDQGQAVLFCGPPGRGKSTLTAALTLRGHHLLSDDGVAISELSSEPLTWPGQAGVRIPAGVLRALRGAGDTHEVSDEKTTHLAERSQHTAPTPVAAVVLLASRDGSKPQLERLDPVSALPATMAHAIYGGPSRLAQALGRVALLAERVAIFRGRLPHDLRRAGEHAEALLALVRASL